MSTNPIEVTTDDLVNVAAPLRSLLCAAINHLNAGKLVHVSLTYRKQTKAKPRIAGEHYVELPGISSEVMFGAFSAFRTKAGLLRFRILTPARSTGEDAGWASLIPAGLTGFAMTGVFTPPPVPVAETTA